MPSYDIFYADLFKRHLLFDVIKCGVTIRVCAWVEGNFEDGELDFIEDSIFLKINSNGYTVLDRLRFLPRQNWHAITQGLFSFLWVRQRRWDATHFVWRFDTRSWRSYIVQYRLLAWFEN